MIYYNIIRGMSRFNLRLQMVRRAEQVGISQTAREFKTTRRTVRKWIRRYREEGLRGLVDRSRAPKHIPHKTPEAIEREVIRLRKSHPTWGPERLKMHYNLPISTKAIGRIIRQAGLVRRRKRKWRKRQDLREMKKRFNALEFIQIDVKDLSDVERYWPQMMRLGLPRYEFTARDVRTGGVWYAYGNSNDTSNASVFAGYLLGQLRYYGVDTSKVIVQTDNGSEFIGNVRKRGKSPFERVLDHFEVKHVRIPPRACTWQSDVEAFHRVVEDEFYDVEDYRDPREFMAKGYAYQLYFNFKRKNRWKGRKTPAEILNETTGGRMSP